jgi:HEAT repeat protein
LRRLDLDEVKRHIINAKLEKLENNNTFDNILLLPKEERIIAIKGINDELLLEWINNFIKKSDFFTLYNENTILSLFYIIGERKLIPLWEFVVKGLDSSKTNIRRISCSTLGKLGVIESIPFLQYMIKDSNKQVREYAEKSIEKLKALVD